MRIATLGAALSAGGALMTAGMAAAQQPMGHSGPGAGYRQPNRVVVHGPHRPIPAQPMRQSRWGSKVGGKWWGGANAPGGWAAYRQPFRGYRLPTYWVAPRFYVTDWNRYGLASPSSGSNWVRYYDDAVLIDRSGSVVDHRGGLEWDREEYLADGGSYGSTYDAPGPRSGIGGAIAGAAVGGVVGNVVAGRGNRLGGTLIGAGVGAAAGLALDRATDPARRGGRGYDGDYREPPIAPDHGRTGHGRYEREVVMDHHGPDHGGPDRMGGGSWRSHDGRTTVVTTGGGHGGGYSHGYGSTGGPVIYTTPGSVTTITIASAPVVTTTTTTEYYEDAVTYSRPAARHYVAKRKVYPSKRVWRAKAKPRCVCR
ncbi:MAG: hypothetical protein JWN21_2178 [Sphingomonas bacterium]|uniref:RcnB family protein n=1 Tax=Sphingomonas bacterium TaxID=1895847 RepID=UPI0026391E1E|nr:RcnB family protein [Sphingomonas bacterium]MDB5696635.1 hypothetical protein [Sphingomonas bacterium]